jgi:hypothetical protein
MMTTEPGRVSCRIASQYDSTFLPSRVTPGGVPALAPVAMTMFFAVCVCFDPSLAVTSTDEADASMAAPM